MTVIDFGVFHWFTIFSHLSSIEKSKRTNGNCFWWRVSLPVTCPTYQRLACLPKFEFKPNWSCVCSSLFSQLLAGRSRNAFFSGRNLYSETGGRVHVTKTWTNWWTTISACQPWCVAVCLSCACVIFLYRNLAVKLRKDSWDLLENNTLEQPSIESELEYILYWLMCINIHDIVLKLWIKRDRAMRSLKTLRILKNKKQVWFEQRCVQ